MKPITRISFALKILTTGLLTLIAASALVSLENSGARIVRLSFVEGEVTVQRPDLQAWAEAPVNTPLQEGFKLATGDSSFAEMQLENGGTVRLGEHSALDLTRLQRTPDGATLNQFDLQQGYATFHPLPSRLGESIQVGTPYGMIIARGSAQFRVDLDRGAQRVEVFRGSVEVQSNAGHWAVEQDSILLLQPGASEPTAVSQGIAKDDWDNWVDDRDAHSQLPPNAPSPGGYAEDSAETNYGWSDLLQYGTWNNISGWGYGWTPATVATGWTPYSYGAWVWYPGMGYTWVGSEPWGWLPYHYGGWEFLPGKGWVWFPGSLRSWSPGRVNWYHGPDWVGWAPRHMKDNAPCGANCGGGVVSTSTFRNGGTLSSGAMLGINPTSGQRVAEPGIAPTVGTRLTGPAVSWGTPTPPNSTNVYNPQHHGYGNSGRGTTPSQSEWPTPVNSITAPSVNPGPIQPVPVGSRPQPGQPAGNSGYTQPVPVGGRQPGWRAVGNSGYNQPVPVEGRQQEPSSPGNQQSGHSQTGTGTPWTRSLPSPPAGGANPSPNRPGWGPASGGHGGSGQAGESHAGGGASGGGHASGGATGGGGSAGSGHH